MSNLNCTIKDDGYHFDNKSLINFLTRDGMVNEISLFASVFPEMSLLSMRIFILRVNT